VLYNMLLLHHDIAYILKPLNIVFVLLKKTSIST
jgi:hypothetical protein